MSLPERIGRYRILGFLASGGMAEILLAKLLGPGGFERAVVLKRVLPHLARQQEFREMFLDEARIVARIQHANVVHVSELGQEGRELFMVMEYLAGESVGGLARRLAARGRPLDPRIAAHLIAEAAAGLHAAHELEDEMGQPLGVVHRDVSPQNVFLGYDGSVKLLDFGIAKFHDRSVETHTGQVKGKFAYMSPEQCRADRLDRRSDVFSLGILLWELLTGARLFQRPNELLVWKAIVEEEIPAASSRRAEGQPPIPAQLEAVAMRALAREREDRCASAAELRRELLAALRALDPDLQGAESLSALMKELFPDRIAQKEEMLRRVRAGDAITSVPSAEVDAEALDPVEPMGPGSATVPMPREDARARPIDAGPGALRGDRATRPGGVEPSSRALAFGALLVVAVIVGAVLGVGWDHESSGAAAIQPVAPPPIGGAPVGTTPIASAPTAAASASAPIASAPIASAPIASAPIASAPSAPPAGLATGPVIVTGSTADVGATPPGERSRATVRLRVETLPAGAAVRIGEELRGVTPLDLELARGEAPVPIVIALPGYHDHVEQIVPDVDQRVRLTLDRERRRAGARAATKAAAGTGGGFFRFD